MKNRLKELKQNKKGFTLMEMIVVIVIIGILLGILVPGIIKWVDSAKEKKIQANARTAYLAVEGAVLEALETETLEDAKAVVVKDGVLQKDDVKGIINKAGAPGEVTSITFVTTTKDNKVIESAEIEEFVYVEDSKQATYKDGAWEMDKAPANTGTGTNQ